MPSLGKSAVQSPLFEAREIGGIWDIIMRIPHPSGGASVESIIGIKENTGTPPDEATIARRVCALLNKSAHIDTEDLCADGFGLHLLEDAVEKSAAEELGDLRMKLANTQREVNELKGARKPFQYIPNSEEHNAALQQAATSLKEILFGPNVVHVDLVSLLMNAISHINHLRVLADAAKATARQVADRVQTAEAREHPASELSDREKDIRDTNESLRRALRIIGKEFGISSSSPELIASAVNEQHEKMCGSYRQLNNVIDELREIFGKQDATPQSLITYVRNLHENAEAYAERADKAMGKLEYIEKLMIEHEHHTEGVDLWISIDKLIDRVMVLSDEEGLHLINTERALADANGKAAAHKSNLNAIRDVLELDSDIEDSQIAIIVAECQGQMRDMREANKETAGQLAKADQELAQARGERDEAYRTMKGIERALGVVTEKPGQLEALIIERLNELTSVKSSLLTMPPFKIELMQLCMIEPSSPNMLPSLPELLIGVRDYVNTITRYRGGAMILHDLACQLTGTDSPATDAEPYANIPWQVLADRLEEQFNAPRRAILNLADNYELDRESDNYADAMAELYSFIKGLTVAQFKHDQQLQTLFADRNADRAIIGAIDDLCGDVANRPAVPVMAAIRALVQSHIRAIYSKEKNNG